MSSLPQSGTILSGEYVELIMLKKSSASEDFGVLRLRGDFCHGQLESIMNLESGLYFDFGNSMDLFSLVIEEGDQISIIKVSEFKRHPVTGLFTHPDKDVQIAIEWLEYETDTALCRFKFTTGDRLITVRKIIFELPGCVVFPDDHGPDFLVYPRAGGMIVPAPSRELFRKKKVKTAKWQDRHLSVWEHGFDFPHEGGAHSLNFSPSMTWLDYFCDKGGLYLASHDPQFEQTEIIVEAKHPKSGLNFKIIKTLNRQILKYETDFAIGLHKGDWHRGADIYRKFFNSTGRKIKKLPEFMKNSPGIMCHYDFKWQDGHINHRFCDIPALHSKAVIDGFSEILIAGWNINGFDNFYPDFRPDPELGTEQELIEAIKTVKASGGKVFFYVNAYSFDEQSPDFAEAGNKWAVKKQDNSKQSGQWGSSVLVGMCNSCSGWREKVKDNIRYIIEKLGASGVYIDQLNVTPQTCYDTTHRHEKSWKLNNFQIIDEVRKEMGPEYDEKILLFSEWLTDILATELDAQLIHVCWMGGLKYAFPEMFRYTFPEAALFDQVLQKPWGAVPREIEADHVKDVICRMFINGILFWTYDHVPDTTGIGIFFKQAVELKKRVSKYLATSKFVDDIPIAEVSGTAEIKSYELPDGQICFCVWNKKKEPGRLNLKQPINAASIITYDFAGSSIITVESPIKTINIPASELSVILTEN
jgi:Domain of unknown function (DUF6259)